MLLEFPIRSFLTALSVQKVITWSTTYDHMDVWTVPEKMDGAPN